LYKTQWFLGFDSEDIWSHLNCNHSFIYYQLSDYLLTRHRYKGK